MKARNYLTTIEYVHDRRRQVVHIPASSREEAEQIVRAIRHTGRMAGWPTFRAPSHWLVRPISMMWLHFRTWVWKRWGF